ncbi:type II secretion system protein [Macrococcus capreoli]|uniref:type II secretion system protein n=1 Tax=Macrococcus capreoli TaxID=2982690 RepID=UPI0021D5A240|nr:type II secretion system protein [Macrococcus sp. TMW 2.2395]MCU7556832.1 type II secretion system GspH family protein [Macrococcus sp. TMW 2.2395]
MRKYKGFVLIDSLLSFSVVMIITLMLLPIYYKMNDTYEKKKQSLEAYRLAYVEIVINERGGYIEGDKICYKKDQIYCISAK